MTKFSARGSNRYVPSRLHFSRTAFSRAGFHAFSAIVAYPPLATLETTCEPLLRPS